MMDIIGIFSESFWYIAPILVSLTVALSTAINNNFKVQGSWKQVVAWLVGAALSVAAYFGNFVTMGDPQWLGVIALCVVVGLSSNGFYDINVIREFVNKLFPKKA